ncbi:LysR substrate-binding domain-containing protein [Thalassococcus arenae]|uniref:LysR substrate-binding domain-containing protein n=1 Tax=Thalassococcus arenae TaxID=2851652 RepID=UPI0020CB25AB|nr:LysR substrate-binding domain-containing protein [Thalassococcus arenae]
MTDHDLPPLNSLRAFDAAGRHLSFARAAQDLRVTQGAVAQQVRGLEARLGVALFERHARGLRLTEAGRAYHREVADAFARLTSATAALRTAPNRVTVSVTPTFASKWLIPALGRFPGETGIDLRVLATESVARFAEDGVDIAVRQGNPPFGPGLEAVRLFRQRVVAVAAPGLLRVGDGGADALARAVLLRDAHDLWPEFFRVVLARPAPVANGPRFNQTTLAIDAALSGQGVALASAFLIESDLAAGRLEQVVPGAFEAGRDFHVVAPSGPRRGPVATVFDWLLSQGESGN